ncbi:MAG: amidohydrolase family protein [Acidobacteriaceae bacterium]|nr:amidohydrolase family protein [Acidobacteriaceae bacterium]
MLRSALLAILAAALLLAAASARALHPELALVHARVYPAPDTAPLTNATILLRDGHIVSISEAAANTAPPLPPGAAVLDCTGMTVTAGLWNSHVHILPFNLLHAAQKTGPQLTAALQEMLTRWGFTTVFDIASVLDNTNNIRARIASGEVLGPRILTTGEPFFPEHGVPIYVQKYLADNHIVLPDDPDIAAAVARVSRQIHDGADAVKIFAGSSQADRVLLMPLDRAKAIVQEAHRLHRPVFAHPGNVAGMDVAIDSGVDVLAHVTSEDSQPWTPAIVDRLLSAHMALIPTLTLFDVEAHRQHLSPETTTKFIDLTVARLRAYHDAGGQILFGTDVGYIYQFDTAEEYTLMQRAGMTFPQILASLTVNPASRFGFASHTGRIVPNFDADLTVFAADPAADITALARVKYTIRAGKLIYQ